MRGHHKILVLSVLGLAVACTDGRRPEKKEVQVYLPPTPPPATALEFVANVRFQEQNTEILSIVSKGPSLFLTGRPFGFSRWEVGQDAENPQLTFAVSQQINSFSAMGRWVVDWYASGALAILGNFAFMSGTKGMSVTSMQETQVPREVARYPSVNPASDDVPSDEAFIYRAIVAHPSRTLLYGFRSQDYVYTINVGGGSAQLTAKKAYGAGNVCCVNSATVFAGNIWVAFRSSLVMIPLGSNGSLGQFQGINSLQAINVASTPRYLYVHHEPNYTQKEGQGYPAGIYVFDTAGQMVAHLYVETPPINFAAAQDDQHLFINFDNTSLQIHRINWAY